MVTSHKDKLVVHKYGALKSNAVICFDLHYLLPPYIVNGITYLYVIAFMDDYSRYIIHWEFLTEKTAAAANVALEHLLEKLPDNTFGVFKTDNGGEFKGIFF